MVGVEVTALGVDPTAPTLLTSCTANPGVTCQLVWDLSHNEHAAQVDGRVPQRAGPPAAAGHLRRAARARRPVHRQPGDQPADRAGDHSILPNLRNGAAAARRAPRRLGGAATAHVRIRGGRPRRGDPGRGGRPRGGVGVGRRGRPGRDQRRRRRGRAGPGRRAPQAAGARPRVDLAERGVDHDLLDRRASSSSATSASTWRRCWPARAWSASRSVSAPRAWSATTWPGSSCWSRTSTGWAT